MPNAPMGKLQARQRTLTLIKSCDARTWMWPVRSTEVPCRARASAWETSDFAACRAVDPAAALVRETRNPPEPDRYRASLRQATRSNTHCNTRPRVVMKNLESLPSLDDLLSTRLNSHNSITQKQMRQLERRNSTLGKLRQRCRSGPSLRAFRQGKPAGKIRPPMGEMDVNAVRIRGRRQMCRITVCQDAEGSAYWSRFLGLCGLWED